MINKFEKLDCWKLSRKLATDVYLIVQKYPTSEIYSLTNQTTRAAISISANIAEGSSRSSKKDFGRFLEISIGSRLS
jgi:four helix bundle protein